MKEGFENELKFLSEAQETLYRLLNEFRTRYGEKHQYSSLRVQITEACGKIEDIKVDMFGDSGGFVGVGAVPTDLA